VKDQDKTKAQLIHELTLLRERVAQLETEKGRPMRMEESLRASENKFRIVADNSNDWEYWLSPEKECLYTSPSCQRICGYSVEEFQANPNLFSQIVHPDDLPHYKNHLEQERFTGGPCEFEFRIMHRDGTARWIRHVCQPIFDENKNFLGWRGNNCDITERRQAEEALRDSERMLHLVLDTIPVRVFWKDIDSNFLGCNRSFALDAGLKSPEEIIGKNDFEMGWAEQAELYRLDDRLVMETGRPKLGYEEPQTTPDGGRIWLRTNKVPLRDAEGRISGVLGTYEEITESKRMEEDLQKARDELERRVEERTAELEKANKELRQIPSKLISVQEEERKRLASELHDSIGQTLAAVKFWVEMSLKFRDERDGNAVMNHLEQFVPILQRSIEETRSIYMGLRPSILDKMGLLATLEWLRRECMKLYPSRHIELETGLNEKKIPESLKINIFRIAQEALNNVAKHSKAEWVDISLSQNGDRIELVVSDDGVGMKLDSIFQTDSSWTLGLTSMRERAELTGGSFEIESAPGEGTTIRASWPIEVEDKLQ